jgi:hypothetical protein
VKLTVGDVRKAIADLPDDYPIYVEHTDDTEDWVVVDGFRAVTDGPEDEGCLLVQAHVHYEDADEECDECGAAWDQEHMPHCSMHGEG